MRLHGNAALSWSGRRRLAERVVVEGWTQTAAAEAAGVSVRCARKWVGRYRLEGERGLLDRSSGPRRVANRTPEERVRLIVAMRRLRFTAAEIAELLGMALSTVSGILTRLHSPKLTHPPQAWIAGSGYSAVKFQLLRCRTPGRSKRRGKSNILRLRSRADEDPQFLVRRRRKRLSDGSGAIGDTEPREDVFHVLADRVFGDDELPGDLGVGATGGDETKQLPLPRGEIGHRPATAFELLI